MRPAKEIAKIAHLIGDQTRAQMLILLMAGKAMTAGELARRANVSPQTASNHLSKLMQEKLIAVDSTGRHRYYRLASKDVAASLESLLLLTPIHDISHISHQKIDPDLCQARTCYDHLAGKLGVNILQSFIKNHFLVLEEKEFLLTQKGESFFSQLEIPLETLRNKPRSFARPCMDWTERQHHLAGSLGKAILEYFFKTRWIIPAKEGRAVFLTAKGKNELYSLLKTHF